MDLVVDANILFAALIKESVTSELLFVEGFHLYVPEFLISEFSKYKNEILRKTHRTEEEFSRLIGILEQRIMIIPTDELKPFLDEAMKISPDEKDVAYIATALKINGTIWSNDQRLKNQNKIPIYSTEDLLNLLKYKNT